MIHRVRRGHEDVEWIHGPPLWAKVRPSTPDHAYRVLARLAQSLSLQGYKWPADALQAYLSGRARSLDEAFGLVIRGSRGRKRDSRVLHRDVLVLLLAGIGGGEKFTWRQIEQRTRMSADEARKLVGALYKEEASSRAQRNRRERAVAAANEIVGLSKPDIDELIPVLSAAIT